MNPPDPSFPPEAKDAVISSGLGLSGMLARLLAATENLSWGEISRFLLSSTIVAYLCGLALQEHIQSRNLLYACIGLCGACAPEIVKAAVRIVKAKLAAKVAEEESKVNNGKASRKPRRR